MGARRDPPRIGRRRCEVDADAIPQRYRRLRHAQPGVLGDLEFEYVAPNDPRRKAFPDADECDVIGITRDPDKSLPDVLNEGEAFYLDRADCYRRWPELAPPAPPPADRTAKNAPLSKQLDEVIREEIRRARKEAAAAGEKPPNRNEICKIVQPRLRERRYMVAYDLIKEIDKEPEFASQRQRPGVRRNK